MAGILARDLFLATKMKKRKYGGYSVVALHT